MIRNQKDSGFKPGIAAGMFGNLTGRVSNSNQYFIIIFAALLILIAILAPLIPVAPKIFIPTILILVVAVLALIVAGLIRQCRINPMDELNQFSAKMVSLGKSYEIKAPSSFLASDLFSALVMASYPENEPPVGLIQGDVTDEKSIKILNDQEREEIAKKENKEIEQHRKDVVVKVEALKLKVEVPAPTVSVQQNSRVKMPDTSEKDRHTNSGNTLGPN